MAKKIKVSRKQIKKPDEFVTTTERILKWLGERKPLVYGVISGLVLIILLVNLTAYSLRNRRLQAEFLLARAFSVLKTPLIDELTVDQIIKGTKSYATSEERRQDAIEKFKEVVSRFGASEQGLEARFHLGTLYLEQKDWENAIYWFNDFLEKLSKRERAQTTAFKLTAYLGLAKAYYGKGEYEQALKYYQKVLESKDKTYLPEANLGLARTLIKLKKTEEAKKKLKKILDDYPDSIYARLAQLELKNIEAGK